MTTRVSKILKKGVKITWNFYETEASGNITLRKAKLVSATDVDRISIRSLTHSASYFDLKLEVKN